MIACLVSGLALVGCSKHKDSAPAPEAKPAAAGPAVAIQPMPVEPKVAQAMGTDVSGMINELGVERDHRPKAGLLVEQLFDALDNAGIVVAQRTQYFGHVIQASFCAGGITPNELGISMCEYTDQKTAEAGLAMMNKSFGFAGVTRQVHKAAVISVVDTKNKQPELVKKTIDTFLAL